MYALFCNIRSGFQSLTPILPWCQACRCPPPRRNGICFLLSAICAMLGGLLSSSHPPNVVKPSWLIWRPSEFWWCISLFPDLHNPSQRIADAPDRELMLILRNILLESRKEPPGTKSPYFVFHWRLGSMACSLPSVGQLARV